MMARLAWSVAMSDLITELAERARGLAPEERSRLVDLLLESLHESPLAEVEAAWTQEIERRVAAHERGEVETFAAEDVFAEARRIAP
jgi:putative addiction module component (TIGR02574 family)